LPVHPSTETQTAGQIDLGELGVGTWAWGDRAIWRYGRDYGEDDVHAAFEAAASAGVRLFDTAEIYGGGESERLVGRFVRQSRQPVLVATKFFPYPWRLFVRGSLLTALRASLDRLGLERVDLYQVHWPLLLLNTVWADELAEAVHTGLVGNVGVSNFGGRDLRRMQRALDRRGVRIVSNQVHYSLLHRAPEHDGVLQTCRAMGVRVIAYSPLEMGLLGGRYSPEHQPPWRRRIQSLRVLGRAWRVLPVVRDLATRHGRTPAQVALNWLICHGAVPIPGAKSAEQARQNAGALGWRLDADEVAHLDRIAAD
jgi:aryl-alcohol dehydrogenase-like predicted oxidoreductase